MSSGALPKQISSRSSLGQLCSEINVQNSNSELFELEPKPKVVCIPDNCKRILNDLRKTQSLNGYTTIGQPEKSWSVLFTGSKGRMQNKGFIM